MVKAKVSTDMAIPQEVTEPIHVDVGFTLRRQVCRRVDRC
jgi:hypothetical protein